MKYLGLDYGSVRCGVAISDKLGIIASTYEVIKYKSTEELIKRIEEIIKDEKIEKIILGDPKNLDGSISDRSEKTYEFKNLLENIFNIEVILEDERLTTVEAEKILLEGKVRREKRKKVIDKMAARIILQSYLDRK